MAVASIFIPIISTGPAFNSTVGLFPNAKSLESTGREWKGPFHRTVRIAGMKRTGKYYIQFGRTSVSASTNSFLALGQQPYLFHIAPSVTHVSFVSSTDLVVNVALGYVMSIPSGTAGGRASATSTAISATSTEEIWTIQEASSILYGTYWLDENAAWTLGDAHQIMLGFHYSTST